MINKYIFTILIQSGQYIVHTRDVPISNSKLGVLKNKVRRHRFDILVNEIQTVQCSV